MHRKGHLGAALAAYAPTAFVVVVVGPLGLALVGGAVAVALAMLPDWDQKLPFVDHRGPTHTVQFAGAVGAVLLFAGVVAGSTAGPWTALALGVFGFVVGAGTILSHIAADALTPMGVDPFGDDGPHYSTGTVKAANPLANILLLALGGFAVFLAVVVGTATRGALG
jgi:inner membrane protein